MAIIVSQSLASSDPLDQDPTKAVGVALPLVRGNAGYYQQTYTTAEAIKTDLINLLLTHRGERPLNPNFGSDLWKVVFEQKTSDLNELVDEIIRESVNEWMPFVEIQQVSVSEETKEIDIYKLKISIFYYVPNVVGLSSLSLLVE